MPWKKNNFNFLSLLVALMVVNTVIASPEVNFQEANRFYDEGAFAKAIELYETIDLKTAHVYFNLGNAYFRDGHLGKAILNYLHARQLSPRDPDILANLNFAQTQAGVEEVNTIPSLRKRIIKSIVWSRTVTEWCWTEIVSLWLTISAISLCIALPKTRTFFLTISVVSFLCFLAVTLALVVRSFTDHATPEAVVLTPKTEARFAPMEDATVHFQLVEGTIIRVHEDRGQWLYVERADEKQGWISSTDVGFTSLDKVN